MNINQVDNFLHHRAFHEALADELHDEGAQHQPTSELTRTVHFWDFDEETEVNDYNERLQESEAA